MSPLRSAQLLFVVLLALVASGCNAVVRGGRLSNVPIDSGGVFLSTGGSPKPFRVLGFIQVRGYGVEVGGFTQWGDAQLDGTIKGAMATEAVRMGGQGVINIEFEDENPSTEYERIGSAVNSANALLTGRGNVESKDRYVTATGEVIQFLP